jgi:hypothetical protein
MGGTRALLASLGASISLVAGAALSLLVVSFVFAYDGLTGAADEPTASAAVLVQDTSAADAANVRAAAGRRGAVVITTPRRSAPLQSAGTKRPGPRDTTRSEASQSRSSTAPNAAAAPQLGDSSTSQPSGRSPSAGDGVRDLGDAVSSTVDTTGAAAGAATTPLLGPPVSQAVQKVLDAIEDLLKGTTGSLAGALDQATGAKR